MESSHNRLFNTFIHSSNKNHSSTLNFLNFCGLSNIIFIHPARENDSLNPQLSQLLWIIQFHPARENQSLNPQLSQLLWIIQYNFYSTLRWKITVQPSTFSTFSTPLFSQQNQINQLEKVEKVEGWSYHFVSFIRLRKLRVEALILAGKMNKKYIGYSAGWESWGLKLSFSLGKRIKIIMDNTYRLKKLRDVWFSRRHGWIDIKIVFDTWIY